MAKPLDCLIYTRETMSITVLSPGQGARRACDRATVQITWHQDGQKQAA